MPKFDPVVLPGQFLAVEEEYAGGKNTFVDEDGKVFSAVVGTVEFNDDTRDVHVDAKGRDIKGLEVGSVVQGKVTLVKSAVVIIHIAHAVKNGNKRRIFESVATLGVARVSRDYVKNLSDFFKIGDFVRAKVVEVTPYAIELSTVGEGLGVVGSRSKVVEDMLKGEEVFAEINQDAPAEY